MIRDILKGGAASLGQAAKGLAADIDRVADRAAEKIAGGIETVQREAQGLAEDFKVELAKAKEANAAKGLDTGYAVGVWMNGSYIIAFYATPSSAEWASEQANEILLDALRSFDAESRDSAVKRLEELFPRVMDMSGNSMDEIVSHQVWVQSNQKPPPGTVLSVFRVIPVGIQP